MYFRYLCFLKWLIGAHKLVEGFEKANSDNLPEVNIITLAKFIAKDNNFISPEISNIKAMRNGREPYGESAIGYVQLKREGHITTVISCVAPEHVNISYST